jgi:hypothetical protein
MHLHLADDPYLCMPHTKQSLTASQHHNDVSLVICWLATSLQHVGKICPCILESQVGVFHEPFPKAFHASHHTLLMLLDPNVCLCVVASWHQSLKCESVYSHESTMVKQRIYAIEVTMTS